MKVFELSIEGGDSEFLPRYSGTLAEAKKDARDSVPKAFRENAVVRERLVQTDKAGVVAMLNHAPIFTDTTRQWGVTSRGALTDEEVSS